MAEREIQFYRCPGGTVAYDLVIADDAVYRLDGETDCPLCGSPVDEHDSFLLRTHTEDVPNSSR